MKNKPSITISDNARHQAIAALRAYVAEHLDTEIGDLKAGLLFDMVLSELGPTIYNQAIADARAYLEDRVNDLSVDCYKAEFPSSTQRKR